MASLEMTVGSCSGDELQEEHIAEQGVAFICLDEVIGRLIVAYSISDSEGAAIYLVNEYEGEGNDVKTFTVEQMKRVAVAENLHTKILPWFKAKLPFHLDSGELGELTIRHRPKVFFDAVCPE